jgi:hypothetical protein
MNKKIAIIFFSLVLIIQLNGQGYFQLAAHYAPTIWQSYTCTIFGDFITRVDYDGDYVSNNNWDNLGFPYNSIVPLKARRLPAYVYYSVIETNTHYFLEYVLFHPADDFHCHIYSHENDLEGIVMTVRKDGTLYGKLLVVETQAHWDFNKYYTPITSNVSGGNGLTVFDGNIGHFNSGIIIDDNSHPRVFVEAGGHGIKSADLGAGSSVKYYYKQKAEDPDEVGYNSVGYDLLSIFSELWEQKGNCCGAGHLFDEFGNYEGKRFTVRNLGKKFDGDDGEKDAADAPWNWKQSSVVGSSDPFNSGDWFMDPAEYQNWQITWTEAFSTDYKSNPFLFSDLPNEIYNGNQGRTELNNGPYYIKENVNVLVGQTLDVGSNQSIKFYPHSVLKADGTIKLKGTNIVLENINNSTIGIRVNGNMLITNYGGIKFY